MALFIRQRAEDRRLSDAVASAVAKLPTGVSADASREQLVILFERLGDLGEAMMASGAQERVDRTRIQELANQGSMRYGEAREARRRARRARACFEAGDRAGAWLSQHGDALHAIFGKLGEAPRWQPILNYSPPRDWLEQRERLRCLESELDAYLRFRPGTWLRWRLANTLGGVSRALRRRLDGEQSRDS